MGLKELIGSVCVDGKASVSWSGLVKAGVIDIRRRE